MFPFLLSVLPIAQLPSFRLKYVSVELLSLPLQLNRGTLAFCFKVLGEGLKIWRKKTLSEINNKLYTNLTSLSVVCVLSS